MKTFTELNEELIVEALSPENKEIVNAVKKYFKDQYSWPKVGFKTINKKNPVLTVATKNYKNCFNPKDIEAMLNIKNPEKAGGPWARADEIQACLGDWKKFLDGLGLQD